MHSDIFTEISMLLALSAVFAIITHALKQPLIISHIFTGILVGPSLLGLVERPENIEVFGKFGVALLLFIVGLGLNPRVIKEVGRVSVLTGVGQVLFTVLFGFFITKGLGYNSVSALYISIALTFSSTIIILKLLNDKKEHNKLHGKISIGFLLVQDLIAIVALSVASATGGGHFSYGELTILLLKGLWLGSVILLVSRFLLKPLTNFLARSQELLFLFAIAWGLSVATLFFKLGYSLEVGALVAGVALSTRTYAQEVGSRLRPLRDFFIVVFFIALGAKLSLVGISAFLPQALLLSGFVLIGNPLIVMTIMGVLGYTRKTSFKAGLAVAQISEFSLIFVLLGQTNGQISEQVVSLVTVVGIVTIALSSYMIIYSDTLYALLEKQLQLFERKKVNSQKETTHSYDAVLFGYEKGGSEFVKAFKSITKRYVVVDYNPEIIDLLEHNRTPYLYGDVTDPELLEEIDLSKVRLVVSLVSDHASNTMLLKHIEQVNPGAVVICHADNPNEAAELYDLNASYVMMPTYIGSEKISTFIRRNGFSKKEFRNYRDKHLAYLQELYVNDTASA